MRAIQITDSAGTEVFALVAAVDLTPLVGGECALSDAASAHRALRDRSSTGQLVLGPSR